MKFDIQVYLKQISKEELLKAYKLEEVRSYCKSCDNYNKNHTCPEFEFETRAYIKDYNYATLIRTEVVADGVEPSNPVLVFNKTKDAMRDRLIFLESAFDSTIGMPPGCCTLCVSCLKKSSIPCPNAENARYSLEALGFSVSEIYLDFFEMDMKWPKSSNDAHHTASALLSKEILDQALVTELMHGMYFEIE